MRKLYRPLTSWIKANPTVTRIARFGVRFVPDLPVSANVPMLGPMRFGLRRHRWLLAPDPMRGHEMTLGMFRRLIRPGDTVYDIGANIGYYMRFMMANFPVGRLVAFEPMAANLKLLAHNVRLGGLEDRVTIIPLALADRDGQEQLQVDDVSDGSAVLDRVSGGAAAGGRQALGLSPKAEAVPVRRLDTLLPQRNLRPPDMMKIDTEGAESIVLEGAREVLRIYRPRLAVALHGVEKGTEALKRLDELGYACYGFARPRAGDEAAMDYRRLCPADAADDAIRNNNIVCSMDESDVVTPVEPLALESDSALRA